MDLNVDVGTWLRELGLDQYQSAFHDNAVDMEVLPRLTADDLKEIGVTAVGHRRKPLDAIALLGNTSQPQDDAPSSIEPAVTPHPVSSLGPPEVERRQLTVMFCDLAGSTELSGRLDPEDYRAVIASFQTACAGAITRLDGFVAKYMGDGVLAYFGYPAAHEEDASRAVRAGLALIEEVRRLTLPVGLAPLQVRVGIATGLVVVGDLIGSGSAQEQSIAGETPNLAARLQALAPPNGLIISVSTRRLVGAEFELQDLGATSLKGFADPVTPWRVTGTGRTQSRFAARGGGATPLTGRREEIELLVRRWEQACDGEGQAVLVSGEAGIGKSRVTSGFLDQIASTSHGQVQYQCSPYFTNSALHPIVEQIEHAAGLRQHEAAGEKLHKLEAFLAEGGTCELDAVVPFLAALLSIPTGERYVTPPYDPRRQNELTIEAVIEYLLSRAQHQPLVVLIEDVHWADPTTLELLNQLVSRITCT